MLPFESSLKGRRVLVTGHTGFKGGWLSLWLTELGAQVHGIALEPDTTPNFYQATEIEKVVDHYIQDIRDSKKLIDLVHKIEPEIVFHLAAQPLVRRSYDQPLLTMESNILGTANILEACRLTQSVKAVVCVTTDKVYKNVERVEPYCETDALGGRDPYSASKAASELVIASYRDSFFASKNSARIATVRGGNVIGGGDWSEDRLIPDLVRAIANKSELEIRNPEAVRPWQHVLALCHGYIQLADSLMKDDPVFCTAWNFGPDESDTVTAREVLEKFGQEWILPQIEEKPSNEKYESRLLGLDSTKAKTELGWNPTWSLEVAITQTAAWYKNYYQSSSDSLSITLKQISDYRFALQQKLDQKKQ